MLKTPRSEGCCIDRDVELFSATRACTPSSVLRHRRLLLSSSPRPCPPCLLPPRGEPPASPLRSPLVLWASLALHTGIPAETAVRSPSSAKVQKTELVQFQSAHTLHIGPSPSSITSRSAAQWSGSLCAPAQVAGSSPPRGDFLLGISSLSRARPSLAPEASLAPNQLRQRRVAQGPACQRQWLGSSPVRNDPRSRSGSGGLHPGPWPFLFLHRSPSMHCFHHNQVPAIFQRFRKLQKSP